MAQQSTVTRRRAASQCGRVVGAAGGDSAPSTHRPTHPPTAYWAWRRWGLRLSADSQVAGFGCVWDKEGTARSGGAHAAGCAARLCCCCCRPLSTSAAASGSPFHLRRHLARARRGMVTAATAAGSLKCGAGLTSSNARYAQTQTKAASPVEAGSASSSPAAPGCSQLLG